MEDNFITNHSNIANHVVNHFTSLFNFSSFLQDNDLIEDVIPMLITEDINHLLTILPSAEEIHNVVYALNPNSAPRPDGFGGGFFQTFWDIIKDDLVKVVLEFFTTNWILPSFNSNSIMRIPKMDNVDTVDQFRPIAMYNFKFKILSIILDDRLHHAKYHF